jgi:hypothetical protein
VEPSLEAGGQAHGLGVVVVDRFKTSLGAPVDPGVRMARMIGQWVEITNCDPY